ncbi:unnamed protein product [Rhizopus stolonifer]
MSNLHCMMTSLPNSLHYDLKMLIENEIADLKNQLRSAKSVPVANASQVIPVSASANVQMNEHVPTATIPSYAAAASRGATRPVSKKRKLAAVRELMPVDPSAPKGFEYLYLHRRRKLSRAVVRQTLRHLGVDLSRVLDICFSGPKAIGFLVHLQYKPEVALRRKSAENYFRLSAKTLICGKEYVRYRANVRYCVHTPL